MVSSVSNWIYTEVKGEVFRIVKKYINNMMITKINCECATLIYLIRLIISDVLINGEFIIHH